MKRPIIIFLLLLACISSKSQNLFDLGLKSFEQGDIKTADSLFAKYIEEKPNDINGYYNYGVTRLYLQDTVKFCDAMQSIRIVTNEKKATELYFEYCACSDTFHYDSNYTPTKIKKEIRFTEIIEKSKYKNYSTVSLFDKKHRMKTVKINYNDLNSVENTNLIAIYRLYDDNHKLYLFTLAAPKFPGTDNAYSDFIENSPYIDQAKRELNLNKFSAEIEYIVDAQGNIHDINLLGTKYKIENTESLVKYIKLIVESMPKQIPAKHMDTEVDYLVKTFISFW